MAAFRRCDGSRLPSWLLHTFSGGLHGQVLYGDGGDRARPPPLAAWAPGLPERDRDRGTQEGADCVRTQEPQNWILPGEKLPVG